MVSVITINRNDVRGLAATLASVAAQDYEHIEHIVVDGASDDGSVSLLASRPHGIQWVSEPDSGRYEAMNKGLKMASGRLIWFLHAADSFYRPDTVSGVVADFVRHDWDWAYGLSRVEKRDGQIVAIGGLIPFRRSHFLLGRTIIPHQAAIYTRSFLERVGPYDEAWGLAADQLHFVACLRLAEPAVLAEILCRFDADGAGSHRVPIQHYYDITRARYRYHMSATGVPVIDAMISLGLGVARTTLWSIRRAPWFTQGARRPDDSGRSRHANE